MLDEYLEVGVVRANSKVLVLAAGLVLVAFGVVGVGPKQVEPPPQPFFQDFFTGTVLLQGSPPPEGTILIACIDGCDEGFQSAPYSLKADGSFDQLEVNPSSEELVRHTITFYLVNEFGSVRAVESRPYVGVFDFYVQDLTFVDPMPAPGPTPVPEPTPRPTPTASLPVAGDPSVAQLPKIALIAGGIAVMAGAGLLLATRRKVS